MRTVRGPVADALLAAVLLLFGFFGTRGAGLNQPGTTPPDLLAYACVVAAALAVAVRRRWPLAALAVGTAATAPYLIQGYPYGPILLSFAIVVYTVAADLPLRTAAIAALVALVPISAHAFVETGREFGPAGWAGLVPAAAWVAVPFAVGLTRAAARRASVERADRARRTVDEERLRIAQEVHDVVGHGLAAINMQAEIALHLLPRKPEQAEIALTAISRTSKDALDDLKATLAVVRRGQERAPAPGLAQLPALRERLEQAGVPVTVSVVGEPAGELPTAVDLAAYRVVQESLTNVLRHAGTATATVRVEHRPDALVVEVTDTGRGRSAGADGGRGGRAGVGSDGAGSGTGIAGMRQRVTALGGTLEAGPGASGFRVRAELPLDAP
jgi:signal transduction histidine kinase